MQMTSVIVPILCGLVVAAAVFHLLGRRVPGCWLLALFPAALCCGALVDLSGGARQIGQAAFESDKRQLPFFLFLLALSLLAAIRPRWPLLFWAAWVISACICAIMV